MPNDRLFGLSSVLSCTPCKTLLESKPAGLARVVDMRYFEIILNKSTKYLDYEKVSVVNIGDVITSSCVLMINQCISLV